MFEVESIINANMQHLITIETPEETPVETPLETPMETPVETPVQYSINDVSEIQTKINEETALMMSHFDADGDVEVQKSEWLAKMGNIFDAAVIADKAIKNNAQ